MASVLKFLGWRGGIALVLAVLLGISHFQTKHWKGEAGNWQRAYTSEKLAFDTTVQNYRRAALDAAESDRQNAERVKAEAAANNKEREDAFNARIAAARAAAARLQSQAAAANSGRAAKPTVPSNSIAASSAGQAPRQGGLSADDALIATEQAIQLDELIKWVKNLTSINMNGADNGMVTGNSASR